MIIFLYTDKNCEYQATACIRTLLPRIRENDTILYYTVGFDCGFEAKNLKKVRIEPKPYYPTFHYYKAELSLQTIDMFPNEQHFMFTDTDVLFSKRFNPSFLEHTYDYPLASFGPHEYPFIYEIRDGVQTNFNEVALMKYFGVEKRSIRYVWSCAYVFNRDCRDFFEEYTSMCKNEYLLARRKVYFPFHDETAFNVCLFKRNAIANLDYAFVNTHNAKIVHLTETSEIKETRGGNLDAFGSDWEYIHDSKKVIMYHGFKEKNNIDDALVHLI